MIASTFLVVGPDRAPEVHALAPAERNALDARLALAAKRDRDPADVYAQAFGRGAQWAFLATPERLEWLATEYTGPHRETVRGLAACLATGTPYGGPDPSDGPRGGAGDRLPDGPRPGPAPDRVADPLAFR